MARLKHLKLVHTSDIHLGDHAGHPASARAFESMMDEFPRLGADAMVMVGDVFDNARIANDVLEFFVARVRRLSVPVVVLPGNHDLLDENSVYHRDPFHEKPPNLHVIGRDGGEAISFPELTLDLWGRAMPAHTPDFRPLLGMPGKTPGRWLVALAHGHFHLEGDVDLRSSPIFPEEVAEATCDYLALGHWDRHLDVSQGGVKAAYSGAPLGPVGNRTEVGVTLVDLHPDQGVSFQRIPLGNLGPGG